MHFEFIAGNLALDFANTVHNYGAADPEDDLKSHSELVNWVRQAGLVSEAESRELDHRARAKPGAAQSALRQALRLRRCVYEVFSDIAQSRRPRAVALAGLNSSYRQAMAQASLQRVGDEYRLGWEGDGDTLDRVLWTVTKTAMDLITSPRLGRVRQCAGSNCSWLFVDTSRNGMRRWCDMQACGNRAKVRRFRQRGKTSLAGQETGAP
jgi:predicted RNA-binding Zn ribbon-like protein